MCVADNLLLWLQVSSLSADNLSLHYKFAFLKKACCEQAYYVVCMSKGCKVHDNAKMTTPIESMFGHDVWTLCSWANFSRVHT